ncbi:MAG: EAL domain-containing protein [Candidatus Sericytochromatia bacterium]
MGNLVYKKNNDDGSDMYELLPKLPEKKCTLLLSFSVKSLQEKLLEFLDKSHIEYELMDSTIKTDVFSLENFVIEIIDGNNLYNELEMETINLLLLEDDEQLNYHNFGKVQSLLKTYRLIKAKDIVYILNNKTLKTYFQPIVSVEHKEIFAYECLSRGIKKDGSLMGSHLLFKTAAKNNMLYYLDREARQTALSNVLENKIDKKIFINFVPNSIYNPETSLRDTLEWSEKLGIKKDNLVFEVIETEKIVDIKYLNSTLESYREQGVQIALDDIGSGYSSLSLMSELKPDYIKVDMQIIRDIHKHSFKKSILKSLAYLAKQSNIKILAEGVETKDELDYCISEGVDYVQGFFFSKPTLKPVINIDVM